MNASLQTDAELIVMFTQLFKEDPARAWDTWNTLKMWEDGLQQQRVMNALVNAGVLFRCNECESHSDTNFVCDCDCDRDRIDTEEVDDDCEVDEAQDDDEGCPHCGSYRCNTWDCQQ